MEAACTGIGGYSSTGRTIVVYSLIFVLILHVLKRLNFVKVALAVFTLFSTCSLMPVGVIVRPKIFPFLVYGMSVLFILIGVIG